jgi:hypothetical protein
MSNPNGLTSDEAFHERLRRYEQRMHPHCGLRFDGRKLSLEENGKAITDWPAVSGRPGTQGPEYQSYRDNGPLPQGNHRINVGEIQRYEDTSLFDRLKGAFNHGTWRGGTPAWGNYRFWLKPEAGTNTFGRDSFSIHGGWTPGSAGCIDLTSEMDDFADLMQALGQDEIGVHVDYGWQGGPNHRRTRATP